MDTHIDGYSDDEKKKDDIQKDTNSDIIKIKILKNFCDQFPSKENKSMNETDHFYSKKSFRKSAPPTISKVKKPKEVSY